MKNRSGLTKWRPELSFRQIGREVCYLRRQDPAERKDRCEGDHHYDENRESARNAEASRATLVNRAKEQEAQLNQAEVQIGQLQTSRQAAEQALKEARDKLAEAQSARETAERALAACRAASARWRAAISSSSPAGRSAN